MATDSVPFGPMASSGVEEQVHEGLLQLVVIAAQVRGRLERAVDGDRFAFQLGLNQAQRVFEDFVEADLAEGRPGRAGELEHPADDGVNAANLAADNVHQFGVLVLLQQQFNEGLAGDEGILDFVGHGGGEGAHAGQPIELRKPFFDLPGGGQVVQHHHHARILPARPQGRHADMKSDAAAAAGLELQSREWLAPYPRPKSCEPKPGPARAGP